MTRTQLILFSIALLIIAGFLTIHGRNLVADYGTGFTDEFLNKGGLRKTINTIYLWQKITGLLGIVGLACAFLEIGVSKSKD